MTFQTKRGALTFYGAGVVILLLIAFTMSVGTGALMLIAVLFSMSLNTWMMRAEPKRKPAPKKSNKPKTARKGKAS